MNMKKFYYPSGDPEQCRNTYNRRDSQGILRQRLECHKRALWQIGKLRLCNNCYEEYFNTHDVDPADVKRLSDNENDFVEHYTETRVQPVGYTKTMREMKRASIAALTANNV